MKIKIKDLTFGELQEYVKNDCIFSNGKMKIEIVGKNANSWECICGLPTNDSRSIILQGESDKILEQKINFNKTTIKAKNEQLKKENEELKSAQNKLAIEKLEEVKDRFYEADFYQKVLLPMIKELKGEKRNEK